MLIYIFHDNLKSLTFNKIPGIQPTGVKGYPDYCRIKEWNGLDPNKSKMRIRIFITDNMYSCPYIKSVP